MGDVVPHKMPWEVDVKQQSVADTVALLQRDFAYAVINTAILVHSNQAALRMVVNTARGQIIPRGTGRFIDGSTVEFQDLGMPQPNAPTMTVEQLIKQVADVARELGLVPL